MKQLATLLLILCSITFVQAQTTFKSGKLTYSVEPPKTLMQFMDTTAMGQAFKAIAKRQFNAVKSGASFLNFTLIFNDNEALFYRQPTMTNDNGIDLNRIAKATGAEGKFYSNKSADKSIQQLQSRGKYVRIKSNFQQLKWHLQPETKIIQGYRCQKATAAAIFLNQFKKKTTITAWFCPELPFQFGPRGVSGLPGLILELHYNHYSFYATQLELSDKNQEIPALTKGKLFTKKSYAKHLRQSGPPGQ